MLSEENSTVIKATTEMKHLIISKYKVKIIYPYGEIGVFGRASHNIGGFVTYYGTGSLEEPIIKVGNYSQSSSCSILAGGDHSNSQVINISFRKLTSIGEAIDRHTKKYDNPLFSKGNINIGSNVVISQNATILSGVTIGHGAVIGAGAVVTKDVLPFAIVAGNPAKVIRYRFDDATIETLLKLRWWDFTDDNIVIYYKEICAISSGNFELLEMADNSFYQPNDDCYMILKYLNDVGSFIGVQVNNTFTKKEDLPDIFKQYMAQARTKPGDKAYIPDNIFKLSGLI